MHKLTFTDKVRSLAFHADGAYLIAGGDGGDVTIWSVAAAKQVLSVPCHGPISSVACHTESNVVAAASFRSKRIYMITIAMD